MSLTNTKISNLFDYQTRIQDALNGTDENAPAGPISSMLAQSETVDMIDYIRSIVKGTAYSHDATISTSSSACAKRLGAFIDEWDDEADEKSSISDITITVDNANEKIKVGITSDSDLDTLLSDGTITLPQQDYTVDDDGNLVFEKTDTVGKHQFQINYYTDDLHYTLKSKTYNWINDGEITDATGTVDITEPEVDTSDKHKYVTKYLVLNDTPYEFAIKMFTDSSDAIISVTPTPTLTADYTTLGYIAYEWQYTEDTEIAINYYSDEDGTTSQLVYNLKANFDKQTNTEGGEGTGTVVIPTTEEPTTEEPVVTTYHYVSNYEVLSHTANQFVLKMYTDSASAILLTNGTIASFDDYVTITWNYTVDTVANIIYYYTSAGDKNCMNFLLCVDSYGTGTGGGGNSGTTGTSDDFTLDDSSKGILDEDKLSGDSSGTSTDEPTTDEPTTDEPTTDEPSTDEPTTDEPLYDDPIVDTGETNTYIISYSTSHYLTSSAGYSIWRTTVSVFPTPSTPIELKIIDNNANLQTTGSVTDTCILEHTIYNDEPYKFALYANDIRFAVTTMNITEGGYGSAENADGSTSITVDITPLDSPLGYLNGVTEFESRELIVLTNNEGTHNYNRLNMMLQKFKASVSNMSDNITKDSFKIASIEGDNYVILDKSNIPDIEQITFKDESLTYNGYGSKKITAEVSSITTEWSDYKGVFNDTNIYSKGIRFTLSDNINVNKQVKLNVKNHITTNLNTSVANMDGPYISTGDTNGYYNLDNTNWFIVIFYSCDTFNVTLTTSDGTTTIYNWPIS